MARRPTRIRRRARRAHSKALWAVHYATRGARPLPSFLVIGAHRGGTSSFFYSLSRHPKVARPLVKEVHFFDINYWRGTDWYRAFFPRSGDKLPGEATPYYLSHPAVPERVQGTIPDARMIALLRNPVDRAYSHWNWVHLRGMERRSFRKALAAEEDRLAGEEERLLEDPTYESRQHRRHGYVTRGLYADQLERWYARFPREHILVLRSEDYFARPEEVFAQTLDFLGLPQWKPEVHPVRNATTYGPLDPAIRADLEERFAEPNARLARLLGRDLWAPGREPQPARPSSSA